MGVFRSEEELSISVDMLSCMAAIDADQGRNRRDQLPVVGRWRIICLSAVTLAAMGSGPFDMD